MLSRCCLSVVPWVQSFTNNRVEGSEELMFVISNTCNGVFSFCIQCRNATFLEEEDLHNPNYDALAIEAPFSDTYNPANLPEGEAPSDYCIYTMTVYPTEKEYATNQPLHYSLIVLAIFFFTSMAFILFDCLVTRRQGRLMTTSRKQNAIVSSLYPKNYQRSTMEEAGEDGISSMRKGGVSGAGRADIKNFLSEDQPKDKGLDAVVDSRKKSKPIAERFPDVTIMFGDIAGFTTWSNKREPSDIFTLLEAIYAEYDAIAKRMKVYKVEVVGDCYVAVCGLPDPRKNHAVIMARFAAECLQVMGQLTKSLEEEIGPDTSNLGFRVGFHSGSVIEGVLRGDKPRFQLFGDTMNTASRMESSGVPNGIQISPTTADLLIKAGRTSWHVTREDKIQAKGKGEMSTSFLRMEEATKITNTSMDASERSHDIQPIPVVVSPRLNHPSEEFT